MELDASSAGIHNASSSIMDWLVLYQGFLRARQNGVVDGKSRWTAVSLRWSRDQGQWLTYLYRFTWGIEMTCESNITDSNPHPNMYTG